MDNFIKNLEIKNFKSIKHLTLDCKRVNVFIGKPNVGKSNILEALGLFSLNGFLSEDNISQKSIFRYENDLIELYNNYKLNIEVTCPPYKLALIPKLDLSLTNHILMIGNIAGVDKVLESRKDSFEELTKIIEENSTIYERASLNYTFAVIGGNLTKEHLGMGNSLDRRFKKYRFIDWVDYSDVFFEFLIPPYGRNLFAIIESNEELRSYITEIFKNYNLDFIYSKNRRVFKIEKRSGNDVFEYSYSSIADTFQRFIFYLAAIESNSNSVLIFEEPEVHSFPPYVKELAERMIMKDDNQYFVSTHSPYLLQTFIDSLDDTQLNVYLTYYRNDQTYVKALTPDELRDIQDFGYDVFFNLRKFEPND